MILTASCIFPPKGVHFLCPKARRFGSCCETENWSQARPQSEHFCLAFLRPPVGLKRITSSQQTGKAVFLGEMAVNSAPLASNGPPFSYAPTKKFARHFSGKR